MSELHDVAVRFRTALAAFDPRELAVSECADLVRELAAARKACQAVEAVVAARAAALRRVASCRIRRRE